MGRVLYPRMDHEYPRIERGRGVYLYDDAGKRYLDGCSGAVVSNLGHGVEEIARVLARQAREVAFVHRTHFANPALEDLAREMDLWTSPSLTHSLYASSGSEAVELALKVARQYALVTGQPGRYLALSRWNSYHGSTLGALSLSGHVSRRRMMAPLLYRFPAVPPPYCYRCFGGLEPQECGLWCAHQLEVALARVGAEHVAAFFVEPIVGASGGAIVPPEGYLELVREICHRHGVLLVADEIMTGFGRTGKNFALDHWKVEPDVMTVGKGIAAGYASLAGVMVSDHVAETISQGSGGFGPGHTFSNNPLACATGAAVLRHMREHRLVERAARMEPVLREKLEEMADRRWSVGEIRGRGLLFGVEFVQCRQSRKPFDCAQDFTPRLMAECLRRGLVIYPAHGGAEDGRSGDAILVAPPLVISPEEIEELVDILEASLAHLESLVAGA